MFGTSKTLPKDPLPGMLAEESKPFFFFFNESKPLSIKHNPEEKPNPANDGKPIVPSLKKIRLGYGNVKCTEMKVHVKAKRSKMKNLTQLLRGRH